MAQNISIQEGGLSKQFGQINKLKISNSGGGESLWVPEDDVQTESLFVDKNGTYYASKDECYGYDEVSVNITNEVFGYDDDGDFWDIGVDDEGFLEEEELPTEIKVVVPPDKTEYIVAEPINTAGMVVMAYYGDGTEYGEIPREEYTIDPLVATQASSEVKHCTPTISIGGNPPVPSSFPFSNKLEQRDNWDSEGDKRLNKDYNNPCIAAYRENAGTMMYIYASATQGHYTSEFKRWFNGDPETRPPDQESTTYPEYNYSATYNGKTVYYAYSPVAETWQHGAYTPEILMSDGYINTSRNADVIGKIAWSMIYGTITGGTQEITVKWLRPQDEEELTDKFEITVTDPPIPPVSGGDSGGGGSSGGSW